MILKWPFIQPWATLFQRLHFVSHPEYLSPKTTEDVSFKQFSPKLESVINWIMSLENRYVKIWKLAPVNFNLFGNRVFAGVIELMRSFWKGGANLAWLVLRRGKIAHMHTRKTSCEGRERNWREASIAKKLPGLPEAGRSKEKTQILLRGSMGLMTPWFQISSLHNRRK